MITEVSHAVPGLASEVVINVDTWGVPHIYAAGQDDLFIAQGFNAARERLFQIDLWRRRGLGRLSEVFGPGYADMDRAARLFLYRGDMKAEWSAYGKTIRRIVSQFVLGINAFIDLCTDDPRLLPPEFRALNYRPEAWNPDDLVRIRSHGLTHNVRQELLRALTYRDFGPDMEGVRRTLDPPHGLHVPDGLDLSSLTTDILRDYKLATAPVVLTATGPRVSVQNEMQGSNAWVVGPSRTSTGRPVLANDPHRGLTLPSLRSLVHLCAPGIDAIGAGEPALPGVSIGHNERVAFGLTVFPIDQEDLYCYKINPENENEYWYQGRWTPMITRSESIYVAGSGDQKIQLQWTRHGPVIYRDLGRRTAFAVRTVWLEPGTAPYLSSIRYLTAHDADEFVEATDGWLAPGENQMYADVTGTIGWRACGLVPRRPNWDGTMPVPGDGRYEWDGFYDIKRLPAERDPDRGWAATANEMNIPEGLDIGGPVTYDWPSGYRKRRIDEVLSGSTSVSVGQSSDLQCDYVNVAARPIIAALRSCVSHDADAQLGLSLLKTWDCDESASSGPAALFEIWHRHHLRPMLLGCVLRQMARGETAPGVMERTFPEDLMSGDMRPDLTIIANPRLLCSSCDEEDALAALESILVTSLANAVREAKERMGMHPHEWRWGLLHHSRLDHPAKALIPNDGDWTTVGPAARGGSGSTVGNTNCDSDFLEVSGATFRLVMDVGEWDNSLAINAPGQSGDPRSEHYADLFSTWAEDGTFPLLYSRAQVDSHTEAKIHLIPR